MSDSEEIAFAARRLIAAVDALHVVHPSTDVHGHGGIAGAAMTSHCAWQCNVLNAHTAERLEYYDARTALDTLLGDD